MYFSFQSCNAVNLVLFNSGKLFHMTVQLLFCITSMSLQYIDRFLQEPFLTSAKPLFILDMLQLWTINVYSVFPGTNCVAVCSDKILRTLDSMACFCRSIGPYHLQAI